MTHITDKKRITILIGLLLILGFMTTSLVSYTTTTHAVRRDLSEDVLPLTGDNIYSEIQKDLIRLVFISSMMATDTFLRDWIRDGEQDPAAITRYLAAIQAKYGTVTCFLVSEASHTYYQSKGVLKTVDRDEPRDNWYFRVRELNTPYEINLDVDLANSDALTIFINYRVEDEQGRYLGATGCGLTVTSVKTLLEEYAHRYNRQIYFVDSAGQVALASSSKPPPFARLAEVPGLRGLDLSRQDPASRSVSYQRNQQTVLLNSRFIPELGWHLFVEQSIADKIHHNRLTLGKNLLISLSIGTLILLAIYSTVSSYQQTLETLASTDTLTQLSNRNAGEILFAQSIREARRSAKPLTVILLDLDRFKQINDRYGHAAGDAALVSVAATVKERIREADSFSRWGGEEFLLLLKECSLGHGQEIGEQIRKAVEETTIYFEGKPITVRVSLGVAELAPGEEQEAFLKRADQALYQAKDEGRNRVVLAG
ncbi:sensor domain-containing diguanylate cyclase [Desulfogranum mediterraneum]|uniref:sensor domain-containing diguanylate cyclase n=1 Tax=Desulfogranum mediterraneum TaxID=160661 RepID=UPI000423C4CF|nr:sensor domain-containing diguanylate cyclase [Desulfogranum mediterraneum]